MSLNHSESVKQHPLKGVKLTEQHKENIRRGKTDVKLSEDHCKSISEALKGRKFSEDHRRNLSFASRRKVEIDGITYFNIKNAAVALNIPVWTVSRRISSKLYPTWKRID